MTTSCSCEKRLGTSKFDELLDKIKGAFFWTYPNNFL